MRHRVLCISASMGAGHDGAAKELARRLRSAGHEVEVKDFLTAPPRPLGSLIRWVYEMELRYMPLSYEITYRVWMLVPFLVAPLSLLISFISRRRIGRWARDFEADVIVSVYPMASQALGVMRRRGQLQIPVATFLTDFAAHPIWLHPDVDLHLAIHHSTATDAARETGGTALAPGPLVDPRFYATSDRAAARNRLGLDADDRAVLIVAGSWGVGAVSKTFDIVNRSGDFVPVVVCGKQKRLERRLKTRAAQSPDQRAIVLGWTDQMPDLMAACDALVENAGGLSSLEAMAAGLPVVTFRPIAGHGKQNSKLMEAAGVSRRADTEAELLAALQAVTVPGLTCQRQITAARGMSAGDAADDVIALANAGVAAPVSTPVRPGRPAARIAIRIAALAAAILAIVPIAVDTGVSFAATRGVGVAHAAKPAADVVYLAVRLGPADLKNTALLDEVARLNASAVIDQRTAESYPDAIQALADRGIDIENGGTGRRIDVPWTRAQADVVKSRRFVQQLTGQQVDVFVPARRIDGIDLMWCRGSHSRPVVPNRVLQPADDEPIVLTARHTYVAEAGDSGTSDLVALLQTVDQQLAAKHLDGAPLADLR